MLTENFTLSAKVKISTVKKELSRLGHSFTPEDVVSLAKDPKSPLHPCFEWDDTIAAKKWRIHQARNLILSIEIEDGIRAYESVVIEGQRSYVPTLDVLKSESLVSQVLEAALAELNYWKDKNQRYKTYFGGVFDSINEAERTIRRKYGKKEGGRRREKGDKTHHSANKKGRGDGNHFRRVAPSRK